MVVNLEYKMNIEEMQIAAKVINKISISNEELILAIKSHELIIEYFKARGAYFGLIISFLINELEYLNKFANARKLNVK